MGLWTRGFESCIGFFWGAFTELCSNSLSMTPSCGYGVVLVFLSVGEEMRVIVVDELLNGVIHPPGHFSLLDNTAGCDTFGFGLCLLTRRFVSFPNFIFLFAVINLRLLRDFGSKMAAFICNFQSTCVLNPSLDTL